MKQLTFKVTVPAEEIKNKKYDQTNHRYVRNEYGDYVYEISYRHYTPSAICGEKEISRGEQSSVVEFVVTEDVKLSRLVKAVVGSLTDKSKWEIVTDRLIKEYNKKEYLFDRDEWEVICQNLWECKAHRHATIFDITWGFKGIGYMGGTGIGTNVHNLTLDIVTGVKEATELSRDEKEGESLKTLGAIWIASRMWKLLDVRKNTVHLREQIAEADVYCVLEAHPDCQKTVKYYTALGYPVKKFTEADITCLNCNPNATKKKYVSQIVKDREMYKGLAKKFQQFLLDGNYVDKSHGWSGNIKGCSKLLSAQETDVRSEYDKNALHVYILDVKQAKTVIRKYGARKCEAEFDLTTQYDEATAYVKARHDRIMGIKK